MPSQIPAAFTLAELTAATEWSDGNPFGLTVRIALDHEEIGEEVAEVYRDHWTLPLWFITPKLSGSRELSRNDGCGQPLVLASIEDALAVVECGEAAGDAGARRGQTSGAA